MKTSDQTDKIIPAFLKASHEVEAVGRTAYNPHFKSKYAKLEDVLGELRQPLRENDLAIWQGVDGGTVITRIIHKSGQWMETYTPLFMSREDMPSFGSAYTYARRYALVAAFSIAVEDDDDGVATVKKPEPKAEAKPEPKAVPKPEPKQDPQHVQDAKQILQAAKSMKTVLAFDHFKKSIAADLEKIQMASTNTYNHLVDAMDKVRWAINNQPIEETF